MPAGKIYLGDTQVAGGASTPEPDWVRPTDWLPLPDMVATEGIAILCEVWGDGRDNGVALACSGDYQVDWGNGVTTTHSAGTVAERLLLWADYSSSTLTSKGYRQAIITITPQAGQSLTSVDFNRKHSLWSAAGVMPLPYLDLVANVPNASTLVIGKSTASVISAQSLERVRILAWGQIASANSLLNANCFRLAIVELPQTSNPALDDCTSMFSGCLRLKTAPNFDTSAVTKMASMFMTCISLTSVPVYNTSNVTTFTSMFNQCRALRIAPALDYSKATTTQSLFNEANSLEYVPPMHLPLCTNLISMLASTRALKVAPEISALPATGVTATNICNAALGLEEIPAWPMAGVTVASTPFTLIGRLRWVRMTGWNLSLTMLNTSLNADALNLLYTNLSSSGAGKTVNISGAYGAATDDPSIATAKGWTVSG